MKSKIPEERQRMFSDGNKTGRTFILFITKIIYSYLDYIHKTKLFYKFETIFDILNEMRSIMCIEYQNNKVFITAFIEKQIDICDAFEVKIPEGCAPAQARTTQSSK